MLALPLTLLPQLVIVYCVYSNKSACSQHVYIQDVRMSLCVSSKVSIHGLVTVSVLTKNLLTRLKVLQCDQGHDGAQDRVGGEKCEPEDSGLC